MSRFARRKDSNHNELKGYFEKLGFSVADTHMVGDGFPDMIVAKHMNTVLIEAKNGNGKLNEDQVKFRDNWRGAIFKVSTLEDVQGVAEYFKRWVRNI